jgi:hypothetical protein
MTASDCPFWHLQAFLVLFLLVIVLSGLQITASDYLFLKARQHNNQKKKDKKSLKMPKG